MLRITDNILIVIRGLSIVLFKSNSKSKVSIYEWASNFWTCCTYTYVTRMNTFILVIWSDSPITITPNGGQTLHILPYPRGFYRIILRGNQTRDLFTMIEGLVYINEGSTLHYHMNEDETTLVGNGTPQFYVDGRQFCAEAGTTVFVPRNVTKAVRNINSKPVRIQILFSPSGRETYYEAVDILNNNPPVNATEANELALQHGQVNLGAVSQWEDLNCLSATSTLYQTWPYLIWLILLDLVLKMLCLSKIN